MHSSANQFGLDISPVRTIAIVGMVCTVLALGACGSDAPTAPQQNETDGGVSGAADTAARVDDASNTSSDTTGSTTDSGSQAAEDTSQVADTNTPTDTSATADTGAT
ncbi:MAG TPA: hypothetical protein DCQ06_06010, partial [Myxococcales bacterium]|nr:hypothetical protein [Myxococcales bacterium]